MKAQQMFQQGREKISSTHNFPALPPVGEQVFRCLTIVNDFLFKRISFMHE